MKNFKIQISDPKRAEAIKLMLKEMGFEEADKNIFSSKILKPKK
jgi:hypothetical protein